MYRFSGCVAGVRREKSAGAGELYRLLRCAGGVVPFFALWKGICIVSWVVKGASYCFLRCCGGGARLRRGGSASDQALTSVRGPGCVLECSLALTLEKVVRSTSYGAWPSLRRQIGSECALLEKHLA